MNWKEPKKSEKSLILRNKSRLSYKPPKPQVKVLEKLKKTEQLKAIISSNMSRISYEPPKRQGKIM